MQVLEVTGKGLTGTGIYAFAVNYRLYSSARRFKIIKDTVVVDRIKNLNPAGTRTEAVKSGRNWSFG